MDPNRWPPYSQQSYTHLSSGSPQLPLSSTHEDSANNYGNSTSSSTLFPTSQNLQPHSSRTYSSTNHGPTMLPNTHFEPLGNSTSHPSKETSTYYNDNVFNGVSRETQSRLHYSHHRNDENGLHSSENSSRYSHQLPSTSFHSNTDQPSHGPFGELPHQTIRHRVNRFDQNNDNFIPPVSKQTSTAPYSNGPYSERDGVNVYSSAPLSVQSAYSGDTSSLSPALNSVNSPSEYYSSPQNNYGAYNSLQSPAPHSPSVTQQSYPSSPYGNVDPNIGLPPCSPMNGGSYSRRGIQGHQHSPTSSAVMCYNTPSQSSVHHGSRSMVLKSEYPPEYTGYTQERSTYSSVYSSVHQGQMSGGTSSRISSRTQTYSMPQDRRSRYGQGYIPSATVSSPHCLQNNDSHDVPYGNYSSNVSPVQPMQPSRYRSSATVNSFRTYSHHPTLVPVVSSHFDNYNSYDCPPSNMVDDAKNSNSYNSHIEPGINNQEQTNSFPNYDVQVMDSDVLLTRQARQPKADECPLKQPMKIESANMTVNHRQTSLSEYEDPFPCYDSLNMRGLYSPRRRGRRGRGRRGGRFPLSQRKYGTGRRGRRPRLAPSFDNYEFVEEPPYPSHVYLEPENINPMRVELKQEIIDMEELYQPPRPRAIFEDRIGRPLSIEEELNFLLKLTFHHTTSRRTRSNCRKDTDFQKRFLTFARKISCDKNSSNPSSSELNIKEEIRERDRIHLKISRLGRDGGWWECKEVSASESASRYSLSSHVIKRDSDSKEKSKHVGKETYTKHSAKRKNDSVDELSTNIYRTLPAGGKSLKPESEPKKRGRKPKSELNKDPESETQKNPDPVVIATATKEEEPIEETERQETSDLLTESGRTSSLRRRKEELSLAEPEPGPSNKTEPAEFSDGFEDNDDFNLDDSDSDPTWTGSNLKISDPLKKDAPVISSAPKKRGPKSGKKPRGSSCSPPPPKVKKTEERKVVPSITIVRAKPSIKKEKSKNELLKKEILKKEKKKREGSTKKVKKERAPEVEQFLIAKSDLNEETPYLWKVDRKTHMLQRFEVSEQNGVLIYQSSFTYAAWNQFSVSQYVSAKVEIVSRTPVVQIVKFLGPDFSSEPTENSLDGSSSQQPALPVNEKGDEEENEIVEFNEVENFDHLKENFDIYLQSLISQAVDSSFLTEVHKENDEYFLTNINAIESVSEVKKEKLTKEFWDEELKTSASLYPCVNVLESIMEQDECQVCKKKRGVKLLQFYGQPYDPSTLCSLIQDLTNRTQFFVCGKCATTLSLYSRLTHQKYNYFIKCRSKLNEVRGNRDKLESHILLGDCLEDHNWVNSLFEELIQVWRESEKYS